MSEAFEKWWNDNASEINKRYEDGTLHEFIYTSALLRAAEIAEAMTDRIDIVYDGNTESIAAAIRKEAGNDHRRD